MTKMQDIRIRNLAEEELLPPLTKLQECLLKAGVRILHCHDVADYRREKFHRERERIRSQGARLPWRDIGVLAFGALVTGAATVALEMTGYHWMLLIPGLMMLAACIGIGKFLDDGYTEVAERLEQLGWREYNIGYCGPQGLDLPDRFKGMGAYVGETEIPPGAHEIAQALQEAGTEATFVMQQLDSDPFLWVQSIDRPYERYCVFAWDEEGFIPNA